MEALSPMGETVMETSSVLASPQSSRLMMGLVEESMDTLTMSPKPAENESQESEMQPVPVPAITQDGAASLQGLRTSLGGSLSNVMLPGLANPATTTPILLNAPSPTTVAAPFFFNQNITTATAGAPQIFVNPSTNMQPNTTFLLNANTPGGNMQTFFLNPNMGATGAPLVVQTPVTNTAFLVNSSVLNTSPNTLFLTHPSLAGSNGALMLATNQAVAPQAPQVTMVSTTPVQTVSDSSSEIKLQQAPNAGLNVQTLQMTLPLPSTGLAHVETPQNIVVQNVEGSNETSESLEEELQQAVVEESSIMEGMEKNKDMLALRLKLRRPREELVSQGIMPPLKTTTPAFHEQRQRLERAKVGDSLQRKMRLRPDKAQLVHQHILEDTTMEPMVSATHQRLKRARIEQDLDCKIKNRPGPLELIEGNILKAEQFVEQAVKDGKVKFLKTSSMETCDTSAFNFDEDSQEGCSDDPLSPPQSYSQQSDNPPSSVGSVPSPPDFTSYYDKQQASTHSITSTSSSPGHIKMPPTPSSTITIKQEPGVTSPSPFSSMANVTSSSPSSSKTSASSSSNSRNARKKQTKRNKPKEIKFHEYKPPNETASKLSIPPNNGNPYNLLLMQQQLLLQLQLLQQQHHQLILPNAPSMTSSKLSPINPGAQSPSSTTVTSSSSPVPQDKLSTVNAKTRILSNLEDMKVSELKMELKNRGLHVSGTKPQLVERLRPYADVSMSPISTATTSNQDVTSSSTGSMGGTKVTSSTDMSQEVASETSSARPSMSSPPVSPPDFKSPVSVSSEPSEPPSPGSAFDPMSPITFQVAPQTTVPSSCSSLPVSSPPSVFSQGSDTQQKQATPPASLLSQVTGKHTMSAESSESSLRLEMMDMSAELGFAASHVDSDILRKQQQKIEELQRALTLSQLQLRQQQQTQYLPTPPPPPPPPPPPHPAAVAAAAAVSQSSPTGSPMKLSSMNVLTSSLSSTMSLPSTITSTTIPPPMSSQVKSQSPPKQVISPVFQAQDLLHSLGQGQRAFSFSTPPPNSQPFQFSAKTDSKPAMVSNGVVSGQKSSSLPSSPTDPAMMNMFSVGPGFSSPPPNYEEAVRQSKERQRKERAHLGNLLNPGSTESGELRMTKSQDLDDLLEVLVDHGYQIPTTPKNKDMINLSTTRLPQPHASMPGLSIGPTTSAQRLTQSSPSTLMTTSHQNHHHQHHHQTPPPPPPHPQQQQQPTNPATPITIPHTSTSLAAAPSPSPMELPMDVDGSDLALPSLDLGKPQQDLHRDNQLASSSLADKDNGNMLPFDLPSMQVDSDTNFWSVSGDGASLSSGMLGQPSGSDSEMNWLDLMMPSTGSGLTPVSVTPPTSIGAEGTPLGKEPFSLNLFDLNDDAWDIHVTD
ncbi:uncharacterized protein [Diadema setosum]|uniref:uncharacterized protein n=1 Tax=Diadema setosum TaxID=31175 RepID=UPI003B3A98A7